MNVQIIMIVGMVVVFWLFMIRPQQKKAKEQKKFLEELDKGSKVVTIAGIHGAISKINEDGSIQLEISVGTYIKMERSAISTDWTKQYYPKVAAPTLPYTKA